MSGMSPPPIAVLCSDIHLSNTPPPARAGEPDWFAAMRRPLREIRRLAHEHKIPVIIAGDIFDKWNSPPELINFAIEEIAGWEYGVYAIPGQHDLPHHNYGEMRRSAYGTLVQAQAVVNLEPAVTTTIRDNLTLVGFPWGVPIRPVSTHAPGIRLAVVHSYIWSSGHAYHGAPDAKHARIYDNYLQGYHAAVFGDNHKGFLKRGRVCRTILNCGTLLRRISDEEGYAPTIGILYDNGAIERHTLDTTEDKFQRVAGDTTPTVTLDMRTVVDVINTLVENTYDFPTIVRRWCEEHKMGDATRQLLLEAIDKSR